MSSPATSRKRILVAEDDPAIRRLLELALGARYAVEVAEDGAVALARLGRAPPVDLLLCDVMMPQLGGFDLVRRMKRLPQVGKLPVIFLTAKDQPRDVIEGIQSGARHYVTKPFKIDDLVKKIEKILG